MTPHAARLRILRVAMATLGLLALAILASLAW